MEDSFIVYRSKAKKVFSSDSEEEEDGDTGGADAKEVTLTDSEEDDDLLETSEVEPLTSDKTIALNYHAHASPFDGDVKHQSFESNRSLFDESVTSSIHSHKSDDVVIEESILEDESVSTEPSNQNYSVVEIDDSSDSSVEKESSSNNIPSGVKFNQNTSDQYDSVGDTINSSPFQQKHKVERSRTPELFEDSESSEGIEEIEVGCLTPLSPHNFKIKSSSSLLNSPMAAIVNSPDPKDTSAAAAAAAAWSTLPTTESDIQNFGKRALKTHLTQQSLTVETLATLHSALKSCPSEDTFAEDPPGLQVELMPHQKQALAWLLWREEERPAGGILADDMGLGKTLTMISLVLKSRDNEDKENAVDSDDSGNDVNDGWMDSKSNRMPRGGTLVVCPASLVGQWESEIKRRCSRGLLSVLLYHGNYRETRVRRIARKDIVITTYNLMSRESGVETAKNCTELKSPGPLHSIKWNRIILDEAHIVRNHKSQTAMGVFALSGKRRWCLTGTPIQNKEMDLFALLKFLRCSPFDDLVVWKRWVDNKNAAGMRRLSTMMKSLMLRRTKEEIQEKGGLRGLPIKSFEVIPVKLDSEELKIYKKVALFSSTLFMQFLGQRAEKHQYQEARYGQSNLPAWEQGDRVDNQFFTDKKIVDMYRRMKMKNTEIKSHQILVLLLRLRQICCHPGLIREMLEKEDFTGADVEEVVEDLNEDVFSAMEKLAIDDEEIDESVEEAKKDCLDVLDFSRPSSKIRAVLDVISENVLSSEDKAVVVSQWTSVLNIVHGYLRDMGVRCAMLCGSVPVPKRMEMVENFNSKRHPVKVLLLSLTAGGVGLNLVGGNHLFLIDVHWNPQLEAQACDRVYRVGQTKPVHIYKFVCTDTVEERIKRLQEHKLSLAQNVLTGTTNTQASKLSLQDLKMLFGVGLPQGEL